MSVESERYPYITISFTLEDQARAVEAVVDTGFDGDLAVPPELVPEWAAPATYQPWRTAFGTEHEVAVYAGVVRLGDLDPLPARIAALGAEPILGRGVIDRYRVVFDHGERVVVEP